jgi:hypothetical protein
MTQDSRWNLKEMLPVIFMSVVRPLEAEVLEKTKKAGDMTVHYKSVLPKFPFIPRGSPTR